MKSKKFAFWAGLSFVLLGAAWLVSGAGAQISGQQSAVSVGDEAQTGDAPIQTGTNIDEGDSGPGGSLPPSRIDSSNPDAIGVRVVPNVNHYSISRWYQSQGFQGSPQSLIVDGYEAIRDGRTVYVNAANIDTTSKTIYTNIYLISYNQDPNEKTVDILGQIVSHWKFNNNLPTTAAPAPTCSISSLSCSSNTQCGAGSICATSGAASSSCQLINPPSCTTDSQCPNDYFCDSLKAKVTRDIKRLGQIEELREALYNYKLKSGSFPALTGGTYLPNRSISVWPSWSQTLLPGLAVSPNLRDPINRLGPCPGFDPKTCWNDSTQRFVNNVFINNLRLPAGSHAFVYSTNPTASTYYLCSTLETRQPELGYSFFPNNPVSSGLCETTTGTLATGTASNTPPYITDRLLSGQANQPFFGFIRAADKEGHTLTWTMTKQGDWSSWVDGPTLVDTSNPNQKNIRAGRAGAPGVYNLAITLRDSLGAQMTTTTPVTISSAATIIEAENIDYTVNTQTPFNYRLSFTSSELNNAASSYTVFRSAGPDNTDPLSLLTRTFTALSPNQFQVSFNGIIPPAIKFYQDADYRYVVRVTDRFNNIFSKEFLVKIRTENPRLNFNCLASARLGKNYSCELGFYAQDNHTLSYTATGLPGGLFVNNWGNRAGLQGTPNSLNSGTTVTVKATNEYGASTTKAFTLRVNNYCGDGVRQRPNTEGGGGLYNDGYEDCDGLAGLAGDPNGSTPNLQYGCTTGVGAATPNPILDNGHCVYKSPLKGGGYCGDGYCQLQVNGQGMENCWNCQQDCGTCVAHIQAVGREEQIAYFNGARLFKTVNAAGEATRQMSGQANTLAIWGHTTKTASPTFGLAYRVLIGPANSPFDVLDTTNSRLTCAEAPASTHTFGNNGLSPEPYEPSGELTASGYSWTHPSFTPTPVFGVSRVYNNLPPSVILQKNIGENTVNATYLPYVWGQTATASSTAFYCRLDIVPQYGVCRPRCEGRCGGSDGCGGTCPMICSGGGSCVSNQCVCQPSCTGKCGGESDGCGGTCASTGTNNYCAYGGETRTCASVLGWPANSYSGTAVCNSTCSGFDTSACTPNMSYWYQVPVSQDHLLVNDTVCMVRLNVDGNNNAICSEDLPNDNAQWYRGSIKPAGNKICAVPGKCEVVVNPVKCRYLNQQWSHLCYVHKCDPGELPSQTGCMLVP